MRMCASDREGVRVQDAIKSLEKDEIDTVYLIDAIGLKQKQYIINGYGTYSLIMRSRKLEARVFKRWITHEVLPAIRKTGWYRTDPTTDNHPATCLPAT